MNVALSRKPDFCLCENKGADQLRSNCTADQRLCFRYTDSTLNPKFQASMLLLGLYLSVCVRPGWKPRRPVFSRRGSLILNFEMMFNRIFNGKKDKCIT